MMWILFFAVYIFVFVFCCVIVHYMEEHVSDDKPIKKWWRKYVIGISGTDDEE